LQKGGVKGWTLWKGKEPKAPIGESLLSSKKKEYPVNDVQKRKKKKKKKKKKGIRGWESYHSKLRGNKRFSEKSWGRRRKGELL